MDDAIVTKLAKFFADMWAYFPHDIDGFDLQAALENAELVETHELSAEEAERYDDYTEGDPFTALNEDGIAVIKFLKQHAK
jgi:hypothetical protein